MISVHLINVYDAPVLMIIPGVDDGDLDVVSSMLWELVRAGATLSASPEALKNLRDAALDLREANHSESRQNPRENLPPT